MTTTHRITTSVLLALALGASAAPASARTFDLNSNGSYVLTGTGSQVTKPRPSVGPPPVRVIAHDNGFDWGDAGIGAAGGLALSMMGLGGALAVSQHRARRSTALPR